MKTFSFGQNWREYSAHLTENHIVQAQTYFLRFTGMTDLKGKRFLDIGCGSGINSLLAHRMGASKIVSFDKDPQSVQTSIELKSHLAPETNDWTILTGDVLNKPFMESLGTFDFVYAWGVLHHTGHMWQAIDHVLPKIAPGGHLYLAIYNEHWSSPIWKWIKRIYASLPHWIQKGMLYIYAIADYIRCRIRSRFTGTAPLALYSHNRGMSWFYDLHDWLGGYPYEFASAESIQDYIDRSRFDCIKLRNNRSPGCSEFLFKNKQA